MRRRRLRKGSTIVIALLALSLVATGLFLLGQGANTMMFNSNRAYVEACSRNLTASALAWAQQNRSTLAREGQQAEITLDVERLEVPNGHLGIILERPDAKSMKIEINTKCRRGRMAVERSQTHLFPLER